MVNKKEGRIDSARAKRLGLGERTRRVWHELMFFAIYTAECASWMLSAKDAAAGLIHKIGVRQRRGEGDCSGSTLMEPAAHCDPSRPLGAH